MYLVKKKMCFKFNDFDRKKIYTLEYHSSFTLNWRGHIISSLRSMRLDDVDRSYTWHRSLNNWFQYPQQNSEPRTKQKPQKIDLSINSASNKWDTTDTYLYKFN